MNIVKKQKQNNLSRTVLRNTLQKEVVSDYKMFLLLDMGLQEGFVVLTQYEL